jgi:hypothetical protein
VSCCCEKLVAYAGETSGTQRMENVRGWSGYLETASEDLTVGSSVCVRVCVRVCVCNSDP